MAVCQRRQLLPAVRNNVSWGDVQFDSPSKGRYIPAVQRMLTPSRLVGRLLILYCTIVVPIMAFGVSWETSFFEPAWRSPDLYAHLTFMLSARAGYPLFPLLLYSIVCLTLVLFWRRRFGEYFLVRLGVYGGVVLGLHFSMLLSMSMTEAADWVHAFATWPFVAFLALSTGGIVVACIYTVVWVFAVLQDHIGARNLWGTIAVMAFFASLVAIPVIGPSECFGGLASPFLLLFFVSLTCGPFWFLAAYCFVAAEVAREYWNRGQFRISQLLLIFTWLGGYFAATRAALELAWVEYQKLPVDPPADCYIATAAAQGHRFVVRCETVRRADGSSLRINRQLQVLKCGEIALRVLTPRTHRVLRSVYDMIGPCVARCLRIRLLADITYLSLKPFEWLTVVFLQYLVSNFESHVGRMYRKITDQSHL